MSDTKQRIAEYKQLLPGLKERVVAVALLLVISLTMVTTTTFAWLVLSRRPQLTGVSTTIAANGNLEIALVGPDGSEPGVSAVGDSNLPITERNLTWGNLINLSDESYGLEHLMLRPAKLNDSSLLTSPLYGAMYDESGRVIDYITDFGYTKWILPTEDVPGYFGVSREYGVRAISSTTIEAVGAEATWLKMLASIRGSHAGATSGYDNIVGDPECQDVLATIIGIHMTASLNGQSDGDEYYNPECERSQMEKLLEMYDGIIQVYQAEATAMADLLNTQLFLTKGEGKYVEIQTSEIFTITDEQIIGRGLASNSLSGLTNFQTYYQEICEGREKIDTILKTQATEGGVIRWRTSGMIDVIKGLVDIDQCLITYEGETKTVKAFIKNLSDNPLSATSLLNATVDVEINNGVLYQLERQLGTYLQINKLPVTAKMYVNTMNLGKVEAKIYANVVTTAKAKNESVYYTHDYNSLTAMNTGKYEGGEEVAADTYALVVDFWVRTNAEDSYLTLCGNVLTVTEEVNATTRDTNGNEVYVYTLTVVQNVETESSVADEKEVANDSEISEEESTEAETITIVYELYKIVTDDATTWYNATTHNVFTFPEGYSEEDVLEKKIEVTTVVGYNGENRVWEDEDFMSTDATTQGSGSCYVFYYSSPEDRARILDILGTMRVAFVDESGKLLAKAYLNTELFYDDNGRVIVPMMLEDGSLTVGDNETPVITYLEKNQATRITAIVYLDGTNLENTHVLASASIQGQVNLQFSNTTELDPVENADLQKKEIKVSADVSTKEFDYEGSPVTTTLTATVKGSNASTVQAFFMRSLNATQGIREQVVSLTKQSSGTEGETWTADYTFTSPGQYILKSIRIDGVDYSLSEPVQVTVKGFTVKTIDWDESADSVTIMNSNSSYSTEVWVQFASSDSKAMPTSVRAVFSNEEASNTTSATLTYDPTSGLWRGDVTFYSSGYYVLNFLVFNGEYHGVEESLRKYADVTLGMTAALYTEDRQEFKYLASEMIAGGYDILNMRVKIFDDRGEEIKYLDNVSLTYGMDGSTVETIYTELTYNSSNGYYMGEFDALEAGPGVWEFVRVNVGDSRITKTTSAPTFTIRSPEPPSYSSSDFEKGTGAYAFLYTSDNTAEVSARLAYTMAADVYAVFTSDDGVTAEVKGEKGATVDNVTEWTFKVPTNNLVPATQDGTWHLTSFKCNNVYDQAGTLYTYDGDSTNEANNPYVIDAKNEDIGVQVLNKLTVTFVAKNDKGVWEKHDYTTNFGGDGTGTTTATAEFMSSHDLPTMYVQFTDYKGNEFKNGDGSALITNVKLVLDYTAKSSVKFGGYTSTDYVKGEFSLEAGVPSIKELSFTRGTDGVWSSAADSLLYAGEYTAKLTYDVNLSGKTKTDDTPVFTVSSKAPTVKVTGTDPKPGTTTRIYSVKTPTSTSQAIQGEFFSYSDYSATVYIYTPAQGGGYDQEAAEAYAPKVTLGLSGVPAGYSSATMEFKTKNSDSNNSIFSFANGSATAEVGKAVTGVRGWFGVDDYPECYPAGTMTQNKISITYGKITYEITLSNTVTIDQPQSPTALNFVGIPGSYTGTKPAQVIGVGTTVTVTLPELYWTATIEEPKDGTWSAYTAIEEVKDETGTPVGRVYAHRTWTQTGACGGTDTYNQYQYYIWTKFQSSITAETDIYTQAKKIVQWNINGKTYNAGQTITVTGDGIINATAVVSDNGTKTFVETKSQTTTKDLYGYVKETTVSDSLKEVQGTMIGSTQTGSTATFPTVDIADVSNANAATDTPGTNTTTDSGLYSDFWP